jgi:hypothetical protein
MCVQKAIRTPYSIRTFLIHANEFDAVAIVTIGCANFVFLAADELDDGVKNCSLRIVVLHALTIFVIAMVGFSDVFSFS